MPALTTGTRSSELSTKRQLRRLVRRPGRPGVDEGRQLGGQAGQLEQPEPRVAEQRHPQLQVGHRQAAADQAVELRAGCGSPGTGVHSAASMSPIS